MYEYKFVNASLGEFFRESNYKEIITQYSQEGWRLVQILPIKYNGHGKPTNFEIIFEKKSNIE